MLLEIVFCLLSPQLFPVKLKGAMSGLKEPISGQTVHSLNRSERVQLLTQVDHPSPARAIFMVNGTELGALGNHYRPKSGYHRPERVPFQT